jgi:hypothetical protein
VASRRGALPADAMLACPVSMKIPMVRLRRTAMTPAVLAGRDWTVPATAVLDLVYRPGWFFFVTRMNALPPR